MATGLNTRKHEVLADQRIKLAKGPTILLKSGNYFDLLDPFASRFGIQDIAHGLSLTCRFAGQCKQFYSVAEHSWHASFLVAPEFKLAALMHDAAEAFLGDVTRPLKSLLPEYKRIEANVEAAIAERFAIVGMHSDAVKRVDASLLAAEQEAMMPPHADAWAVLSGVIPAPVTFRYWTPPQARDAFLDRIVALSLGDAL